MALLPVAGERLGVDRIVLPSVPSERLTLRALARRKLPPAVPSALRSAVLVAARRFADTRQVGSSVAAKAANACGSLDTRRVRAVALSKMTTGRVADASGRS